MRDEPNFKHYTRGGQISFHNLRMWDQITKSLVGICLFLWVILTGLFLWGFTSWDKIYQAILYLYAVFLNGIGQTRVFDVPFQDKLYKQSVKLISHHPYYATNALKLMNILGKSALAGFMIAFLIGIVLAIYFIRRGKQQTTSQFIRGSQLDTAENVKKRIFRDNNASTITIDGFPLIKGTEVQHLLIHGTVGTGKSQLMMKIIDHLREKGDRVIVYDKGCSFIPLYFNENKDKILNPFDQRCPHWDFWQEAKRDSDFDNMAESLIPNQGESDPFWINAARTVFSCTAAKMREDINRSEEKLLIYY